MTCRDSPTDAPARGKRVSITRIRAAALLAADAGGLLCAWLIAVALATWAGRSWWTREWNPLLTTSGRLYTLMALLVIAGLVTNGQYARRAAFWEENRVIWRYALLAALTNFALNFFLQVTNTRTLPVLAWAWALLLLPLTRLLAREVLIRLKCWWRAVLIVGACNTACEAAQAIRRERHLGLHIAGFVQTSDTPAPPGTELAPDSNQTWAHGQPVYVASADPEHDMACEVELLARRLGCEAIVVALNGTVSPALAALVGRLHAQQFVIFTAQTLRGLPVQGMKAQHFFSNDVLFLCLQHRIFSPLARIVKRSADVVNSALLLLLLSPLMAWAAWLIWREDGAPVFYRQTRVGRDERDFAFIKFRTMVRGADALLSTWQSERPDLYARYEASNFKLADDPRVLTSTRWMRRLSVDELPQLWNVLRGDMSLVGPRPLLRRELPRYPAGARALYSQVRPGITGLWQVNGRSHTRFEERADYDSWYVRNWSLWVDWVILLKTVRVVFSGRGAM
ncbi:MAG: exopolysaccharide biosynthesis polyprenyl glycosylphosphotransferase [Burkholderiaceae bacterium]|jgi:undecaprenyl-phosphate galactose phosphotransferase|nr:exopolysaccharide biosynthesis polyprenyl glycosylphosphotransferase [Burkholderiaceae bacterium]